MSNVHARPDSKQGMRTKFAIHTVEFCDFFSNRNQQKVTKSGKESRCACLNLTTIDDLNKKLV